ncbi:15174_t:CDS:2 [Acaulospora morrowiae]|uniref:15174_t:CDS:1 n=1 Tax=Acaulospora morrowiae TaxID=94023 RepID=A0A9N9AMA8_9GLOM|nr:15174_t:CDS:2 [Acaulospora morrowiae]
MDVTQEMNILKHKYLKSISMLEADTIDISIEGNLLDTGDSRYNSQDEKPTGEPNIVAIFNNYTDAEEVYIYPISEFENSKPRLALTLNTYETNRKSENLIKATANNIDFKGYKLTWAARTVKLCHYCRDTQHIITNCNVKSPDNVRTKHGTLPRDRFSTY